MSTAHTPWWLENYMSEPGTVVHFKVKMGKESLRLSSPMNIQVHTARCSWASGLGGSADAATTEKEFFMSDACRSKWNPWLVCPGAKRPERGLCWKNSSPPYAEVGQWEFFNLHLVLGRSSRKSTERKVSELNDRKGKKKLNRSPLESWKALIEFVKQRLKSLARRRLLGGLPSMNACGGASAVTFAATSLWKGAESLTATRGSQKSLCFSDQESFSSSLSRAERFSQLAKYLKFVLSDSPFLHSAEDFWDFVNALLLSKVSRAFV